MQDLDVFLVKYDKRILKGGGAMCKNIAHTIHINGMPQSAKRRCRFGVGSY